MIRPAEAGQLLQSHVAWRKNNFNNGQSNCVEVAFPGLSVATRDSKHPTGPILSFPAPTWHAFLTTLTR
ncbi:DUF397 domain-containing protein [Actinokineospora sp. PR83]|uniref:DUF397 domain-containing protein n=1 Tax=Actinokineospora sp. PR83 TaxID=2884908 RepID=UPI0027DFD77B|nr:DUF397 domain-containing protein [Actinokineospora sp. PR83]MCG8915466.1 DUF397 domain-containing protein [Actinokineospora sp. PR83]